MRMKKYLGTIFLIFGFLEIIVLSAISTFDRVMYEDTNPVSYTHLTLPTKLEV